MAVVLGMVLESRWLLRRVLDIPKYRPSQGTETVYLMMAIA
jgi:hypothetical protein